MNFKKLFASVLTVCMVGSLLAGCGTSKKETTKVTTGEKQASEEKLPGAFVSKNPIKLTIHMHYQDKTVFKDEWPVFNKAAELTNVTLKGSASQVASKSKEVYNIMLASGEISDIIHMERDMIFKFVPDGAFIPLNELIDKNAPNIKAFLDKNPDIKRTITAPDGKIYTIPFVTDGDVNKGWFIRKDWLDKLGLKEPKTVDEYYQVLKAFREKDPNGNGKKDEIPYFNRSNVTGARDLVALFGISDAWYIKDGKVRYGAFEPEYKNAMINIAKWYAEGLIDPEIFTRGGKSRDILIGENTGGSTHDYFGSTAAYNDSLKDKVQGLSLVAIAPPADVNGKVWEETRRAPINDQALGWAISKSNKYTIETIKYFDFWFSDEGRRLANFGIEGVHYDMVNGKPKFKDEILKGKEPLLDVLNKAGAQLETGVKQDFSYEQQSMNDIAKNGVKLYTDNKYPAPFFPKLTFNAQEQKVIDDKWIAVDTFIKETRQRWTLGAEPTAANFDKYIFKLKEMGMEDVIKVYQSAYERYMKN